MSLNIERDEYLELLRKQQAATMRAMVEHQQARSLACENGTLRSIIAALVKQSGIRDIDIDPALTINYERIGSRYALEIIDRVNDEVDNAA